MRINHNNLLLAMARACMGNEELSKAAGLSVPTFSRIKSEKSNPRPATIGKLEWFTVSNQMLELNSGLSRQGVLKARNCLKQYGLIDFISNGTKATSYKIMTIAESVQVSCQVGVQDSSTLNKLNKTYTPYILDDGNMSKKQLLRYLRKFIT